jgi:DNA-binding SARP family transcriptional activator
MASARRNEAHATDPRALYRRGLAESHRGEFRALQTLTAAMDAMQARGDRAGVALAAAALTVTGHCMSSYRGFAGHIDALAGLRDGSLAYDDHADSLVAHAGMLCGLLMLHQDDAFIDVCVSRIMSLLELDVDVNAKFAAGRLVLLYTDPREMRELGQRVHALVAPLADDPGLTPHRLGRWLIVWVRVTADAKDPSQHRIACAQARALAEREDEPDVVAWLAGAEFDAALPARDFARAARAIEAIERVSDPAHLINQARLAWFRGRLALARGEGDAALFHATRSRKIGEEMEVPPPMLGVRLALEAQARLAINDFSGARELFARTASMVAVLHAEEMRDMIRMVDAYEAWQLRRPDAQALLATAFAAPRARQFYSSFDTNPRFGATMCAIALEQGIEAEFARRIVEVYEMAPPAEAGPAWPWPLRIETLGRFALARRDAAFSVQGKAQKKPLELLKALVAFGARSVDKQRLADGLWPDAEQDAAAAALDMAISRLRKLLALPEAIVLEDGKLGLNAELAWLDTWAFDRDVEALQAALHEERSDAVSELGEQLLGRYRGAFLDNEEPQRWMLGARDRFHSRFLRSLSDAGRYHERHERFAEAIALYERGIEVDTLAEDLYRRLMKCHLACDHPAEAARVYRRCRDMLSVQLGIPPSGETEALFRSIYDREKPIG